MKPVTVFFVLILSLVTINLAGMNASLYNLRGERIAPVTVPDGSQLPAMLNSVVANRSEYILPESLPRGIYIVANHKPLQELIGPMNGYPVFLDMTSTLLPNESRTYGKSLIADFDGDGDEDVFLTISYGASDQIYQPLLWICQPSGLYLDETATRLPVLSAPSMIAHPLDMDGDGDLDIFILCEELPYAKMLINDGSGHFTTAPASFFPTGIPWEACVADVDQDGFPDIVVTDTDGVEPVSYYSLWKNNAGGGFINDTSGRIPNQLLAGYGHFRVFAHDYNSDGYPELFLSHTHDTNYPNAPLSGQDIMLLNNGNGYFQIPATNPLPAEEILSTFYYFADTDGDGDADIIRVNIDFEGGPNLELLVREGSNYVPAPSAFSSFDYIHNGLVISDFDLDGDLDVFAPRVAMGELAEDWYFSNEGNNNFTRIPQALPPVIDFTVDCARINHPGDQRPDIFVLNSGAEMDGVGLNRLYINAKDSAIDDPSAPAIGLSAYPNPFKDSIMLKASSTEATPPLLDIYNLRGQKVRSLVPESHDATGFSIRWNGMSSDGTHLPAGIYFVKMRSGASETVSKLLLLR